MLTFTVAVCWLSPLCKRVFEIALCVDLVSVELSCSDT